MVKYHLNEFQHNCSLKHFDKKERFQNYVRASSPSQGWGSVNSDVKILDQEMKYLGGQIFIFWFWKKLEEISWKHQSGRFSPGNNQKTVRRWSKVTLKSQEMTVIRRSVTKGGKYLG